MYNFWHDELDAPDQLIIKFKFTSYSSKTIHHVAHDTPHNIVTEHKFVELPHVVVTMGKV